MRSMRGTFMWLQSDWAPMHSDRRWVTSMVVMVAVSMVLPVGASVGLSERMEETLPDPVGMTCAVYTGNVIYVFGGATKGGILDTIYEVDPESGRTTVLPYTLPSPRKLASSVWTGREAYIIGGIGYDAEPIADIVKFVPGVGVSVVEGAMPYGTKGIPSVWSGEAVYILGNCLSSDVGQHDVIRFDPSSGTSEIIEDVLPIPGAGSSATWAGDCAYIVGGRQNLTILSNRIIRYVPGEGAEFVGALLPKGRIGAACAWDGERVFIFGGTIALECGPLECVPIDYLDEIVVFYPEGDTCSILRATLPEPMDVRAAVYAERETGRGNAVMVPGGLATEGPVKWITIHFTEPGDVPEHSKTFYQSTLFHVFVLVTVVALMVWFVRFTFFPGMQRKVERDNRLEEHTDPLEPHDRH